ncbi:prolipoprotein diacylglyceryl transferase [Candidatus Woesearchaeota archaeon]|nr:prolipoprotein diacylglyceryl transferase [Candidatus Woesearchaeota archaeon]
MFYHNINPTLFRLGPFEIRYYGIIYALGFIITYFFLLYFVREKKLKLKKEDVVDFLFYEIIGIIIGARLFYVFFYNLRFFVGNPLEIFMLWHGGLSFHGGLVGAAIAALIFCRKMRVEFYDLVDACVFPVALALMLGRIGNFLNGELYGRITSVPWCVKFKDAAGCRHPSQIYESFKNLLIFGFLWFSKDKKFKGKKLPKGFFFWSFVILYAVLRFIVEFFREPDLQLGFIFGALTMGQVLCVVMFGVSVWFMYGIFRS